MSVCEYFFCSKRLGGIEGGGKTKKQRKQQKSLFLNIHLLSRVFGDFLSSLRSRNERKGKDKGGREQEARGMRVKKKSVERVKGGVSRLFIKTPCKN
jgi:hypothetical protein